MNLNPTGEKSKADALEKGREWSTQPQVSPAQAFPWDPPYANPRVPKGMNVRLNESIIAKMEVLMAIGAIRSKLSHSSDSVEESTDRLIEQHWNRIQEYLAENPPKLKAAE
ncbi:hypothetical protein AA0N74_08060 [Chromobacterium vaccinii]|uniref:hypothetical protein n=1 Tax=Chromobacterium vaccinii TaxID=1108595 RepID=UPI0031D76C73